MKLNLFLTLVAILALGFTSCSDQDELMQNVKEETLVQNDDANVLTFSSKDTFIDCLYFLMAESESRVDNDVISTRNLSSDEFKTSLSSVAALPENQSLYTANDYKEKMRDYVPNESFAKLLNKDGEIIVNGIIYRITPNGTYYYDKDKKMLFDELYSRDSTICGALVGDKLYKIAEGIFRIDTYWYMREEYKQEAESGFITPVKNNNEVSLRSYGANPDYTSFPRFKNTKENILGFLIKNIIGNYKAHTQKYEHTDKRQVKGEFYENNHGFYVEIGVKGWTDKKNWIGWSKTEADEIRCGWQNVVIQTKLPDYVKQEMQRIKELTQNPMHSVPEYQQIPGSSYYINTTTLVIPGLNESTFKKNINKGSKALYDYLKSIGVKQSETDYGKSKALAIATENHFFYVIKNDEVKKFNCKYYCHVFASQGKAGISLSNSSFSGGNWGTIAINIVINIFKASNSQIAPTLYGGETYFAARFGNEWQGMTMYKEAK